MYKIILDDLTNKDVLTLIEEHHVDMQATSPPESVHTLDVKALQHPTVKFWTIWDNNILAGCAAYQSINNKHAELKSMRTAYGYKNKGIASKLLEHIISDARDNGFNQLSLETGSMEFFKPARTLYKKYKFNYCLPFASYVDDPNSRFMSLTL